MATTYFANTATHHLKVGTTTFSPLWVLLFGVIYFACKGIWWPLLVSIGIVFILVALDIDSITPLFGIVLGIVLAIKVEDIVTKHLLHKGWWQISEAEYKQAMRDATILDKP